MSVPASDRPDPAARLPHRRVPGGEDRSLLHFDRADCLRTETSLEAVWLETDGRGGYAACTPLSAPMSRFHGLLVVPFEGAPARHQFVARLLEHVEADGRGFPLSAVRYGGVFSPEGHKFVESFEAAPHPVTSYRFGSARVTREIRMVRGRRGGPRAVQVRYHLDGRDEPLTLHLRPFVTARRADSLTWRNDSLDTYVEWRDRGAVTVRPYVGLPAVHLRVDGGQVSFDNGPDWHLGVEYADDLARGYDGHEDHWTPGEFHVELAPGRDVLLTASIEGVVDDPDAAWSDHDPLEVPLPEDEVRETLAQAANAFLVEREDGSRGIVAGYPWFGEWGRDSFIAHPGLTLARGDLEASAQVIDGALRFVRDGRLANVFGTEAGDSDFKAVDASMWLVRSIRLHDEALQAAGADRSAFLTEFLPALRSILEWHRGADTSLVAVHPSGLLRAGSPSVATTWMDAVVDDRPVTPRDGLQVEVNALWYQGLRHLVDLLRETGEDDEAGDWAAFADEVAEAFVEHFWIDSRARLADRVVNGEVDSQVRPNMVIAAALEPSPLTAEQRRAVVEVSRRELLTPRGLRTLSPRHLNYRGRYAGNVVERDHAYHQGTVWPWLLGFHVEAELRAAGCDETRRTDLRRRLDDFASHLREHGLGQVSEVFDGDPPHRPGGCFAQAWSVAELLRAYTLLDRHEELAAGDGDEEGVPCES